jgi:putative ATP-binding cassette transporter
MAQTKVALYEAIFVNAAQSVILGLAIFGAFLIVHYQLISLTEVASLLVVFLLARGKALTALRVYVRRDELLVAVKHLEALGIDLKQVDDQVIKSASPFKEHLDKLSFDRLTFQHFEANEPFPFKVGPLSATFEPGSIVFICGNNGSGKSTLAKLICGLYEPSGGSIVCNGAIVESVDRRAYQQMFGAVFSDFCLFSPLFYSDDASIEIAFSEFQETFGLDKNLLASDDLQNAGLSTGQRKRVALALAILEDKPIYIFDEWASDQDSSFRKFFYETILKELASKGKLIFVISHHEDYLHVADRVLEIECGKVRELVQ